MQEPASTIDKLDAFAYVKVWSSIGAALAQVRELAAAGASADAQSIAELRRRLRALLNPLRSELTTALGKSEAYELLLPLVIYCDELVLNKLAKPARPAWPLLQAELFQINDGGERFFQMVDERLQQAQAPRLLLEVLYYCLGCGFLGRYVSEPAKVLPYKTQLAERLQLHAGENRPPSPYRRAERRARAAQVEPAAARPGTYLPLIAPVVLYLATFLLLCAVPVALLALSNLRLLELPTAEPEPEVAIDTERDLCRGGERADATPAAPRKTAARPN
ncbi:MAG TPA: DotU family type IV/VI secretion system protein [Pseudomonadota bacterium]|nr:DotU family type IV/VI secretion system protein [Pseudomonadota bacterium]